MARVSEVIFQALKFYANPQNWTHDPASKMDLPEVGIMLDGGRIATALLEVIETTPWAMPMTLEMAFTINDDVVALAKYSHGQACGGCFMEAAARLVNVDLADMLEARKKIIVERKKQNTDRQKAIEFHTVEERLIAAIYCSLHYTPSCEILNTANSKLMFISYADMEDAEDEDDPDFNIPPHLQTSNTRN